MTMLKVTIWGLLLGLAFQSFGQSLNMQLRSNWDDQSQIYNDIWGYSDGVGEYAILGSRSHSIFIDITQPDSPREVIRFAGGFNNSIWRDFKTYRHYAYGVADRSSATNRSGLQIFDLSGLPQTVTKVYDSYAFFDRAHNVFIDTVAGKLYVAGARDSTLSQSFPGYRGVMIFDIAQNPTQPTLLANVQLPGGYIHDLYVRNDTAYCAHVYAGVLGIYDLSTPTTPVALASFTNYPGQGYTHSMWLRKQGDILVFADETHGSPLKVLDVSDFQNLNLVSLFSSALLSPLATNSIAHNPMFRGDSVYISYYHDGIQVFDLSNPASPQRVAYYDSYSNTNYNGYSGNWGIYPLLPSGLVIGSDISTGLYVVEMLSPPLAIEAITFKGRLENGYPHLTLLRASGEEDKQFTLERKKLTGNWEELAAIGFSEEEKEVHYTDYHSPEGLVRYRLAWKDENGLTAYSNEVELDVLPKQNLSIAPNPVSIGERIQIQIPGAVSSISLTVHDLHGKKCYSGVIRNGQKFQIPETLGPGLYLLECHAEGERFWAKVLVE